MPGGATPRALLGMLALIISIAVVIVPVVEARPKDKNGGKQEKVSEETIPGSETGPADVVYVEDTPPVEQALTATGTSDDSDGRTLLELDGDGDYIPDALDNCPSVQNPDQADADGDGNGDSCMVYQDSDGDTVPDKQDNCPNIATSDFSDRDGDGVGDSCDKSPDGIEPEPEPLPELGEGGASEPDAPAPENGENLNGDEMERDGRSRSRQRERTDTSKPVITTGSDTEAENSVSEADGIGGPPAQEELPVEEPVRDNPRRNEELIAESAASGELFAPPEPPPVPQRAWDEEAPSDSDQWNSIIKIDSGATDSAESVGQTLVDDEPNDAEPGDARGDRRDQNVPDQSDNNVEDSQFARGWVRAKLVLQDELPSDDQESDQATDQEEGTEASASDDEPRKPVPVPVENGLVFTGDNNDQESSNRRDQSSETGDARNEPSSPEEPENGADRLEEDSEPLDNEPVAGSDELESDDRAGRDEEGSSRRDGSRRDGSSRGPAAPASAPERADNSSDQPSRSRSEKERRDRRDKDAVAVSGGWSADRFFEGGSALDWRGSYGVAGTDDADLYLTQRSGAGPGKRRGFEYAVPVEESGVYLVRLYFAEPYWGSPGGPEGDSGQRVFSVTAEKQMILEDLDIFGEVGSLTALVKQAEVDVQDGELNLSFIATEGEPIVAAIEILEPTQ